MSEIPERIFFYTDGHNWVYCLRTQMEPELVKEGFTEHTYHLAPKWTSVEDADLDALEPGWYAIRRQSSDGDITEWIEHFRYPYNFNTWGYSHFCSMPLPSPPTGGDE